MIREKQKKGKQKKKKIIGMWLLMVLAICMQLKRRVQCTKGSRYWSHWPGSYGMFHCHRLYPMLEFRPPSRMNVIFAIFGSSNRLLSD